MKGQVVLLDFWASWCGPCRRENPNVVAVYEKYKNKGFTIFSVSLDGLDDRTMSRLEDPSMASAYIAQGKQAWIDAIAIDKLSWPHHVSDLKKWSSAARRCLGATQATRDRCVWLRFRTCTDTIHAARTPIVGDWHTRTRIHIQ